MHRTIMRAFPAKEEGGPGRVLWRLDPEPRSGRLALLVQSSLPPEWAFLHDGARYLLDTPGTPNPDWKERHPTFSPAQVLAFRLRANPTRRRASDGKRMGLITEEEQRAWLARKADAGGFRVRSATIIREPDVSDAKTDKAGAGHKLSLVSVRFEGHLQVVDPQRFAEGPLASGIGPAKAFGFGLLSLAPA